MTQRSGNPRGPAPRPNRRTRTQNAPQAESADEFAASELQESGNPFVSAFSEVADALYALPPSEFTEARNEAAQQAKRAGDRELVERLRTLRRPTAAAHALNLLVRAHPDQVEQLRELGPGLRNAQERLQGLRLRELSARRSALVQAVAAQARREAAQAGQPVTDQAADELDQTLRAVLADETAAEEFAAGRLTHALTPGNTLRGLPTDAPTHPAARPSAPGEAERDRAAENKRRLTEAEQELRQLEAEQRSVGTTLDRVRAQAERADDQARRSRERVQHAERALVQARDALDAAEQTAAASQTEVAAAESRAEQLQARLEAQQAAVDRLQHG
ncbi:hypothetical protein DN069_06650 [Streptacidiphilus pinicola]|uniref:Uncharacterized protein n=1 Tax=Streptacidiphilus pinicola TaxID=2219663 RepID=A0A2X0IS77_9ACTN|nr:hypothetical protein [Streptacidiphilus pinicola]RAG86483.1 hypothetical protein DN069_06650 [Streptacidiphilus pinicola]